MPRQQSKARPCKTRHWVFTLNNPREDEVLFDNYLHTYMIAGKEVSETGTRHVQGYIVFNIRKRLSGVKKWLPRAHFEMMKGTPTQAALYCKKDGDFQEFGQVPKTPKTAARIAMQARWDDAYMKSIDGNFHDIEKSMLIRNYAAFKRIHQDNPPKVDDLADKENYWIVAPTGYGKSTYAREKYIPFYDKPPNKWWVGYENQPNILLDDFGPKQCEYLGWYMKRWADKFPFPAETKGGGKLIRPKRIIVTSQYHIGECWEDHLVCEAIANRFQVVELDKWQERILRTAEVLDDTATTVEYDSADADMNVLEQIAREDIDEIELEVVDLTDDEIDLTQLYGYTPVSKKGKNL